MDELDHEYGGQDKCPWSAVVLIGTMQAVCIDKFNMLKFYYYLKTPLIPIDIFYTFLYRSIQNLLKVIKG